MEKICPNCKNSFTCEGDNDCWCESVNIHKKEMIVIMDKWDDCICPGCLETYIE